MSTNMQQTLLNFLNAHINETGIASGIHSLFVEGPSNSTAHLEFAEATVSGEIYFDGELVLNLADISFEDALDTITNLEFPED